MDFLDPIKKRKHRQRLFLGYGLMAILVSLAAVILMFQTYGYDVDRRTGTVFQNGLVFVSSHPLSADVFINGLPHKDRTDTRFSIPAGYYDIEIKAAGYRSWRRAFNLEGGSVERLTYPLLFPETIRTDEAQLLADLPTMTSQSPKRRWLITNASNQIQSLEKYDLNDSLLSVQNLALPPELLTAFSGRRALTAVEWSSNNRHLLMRHFTSSQQEFVIVDTENPAQSFNLNRLFELEPATIVSLRDKSHTKLHFYDPGTKQLRAGEVANRATSPIAENVVAFKALADEPVIYVSSPDAQGPMVKIIIRDRGQNYTLRESRPGNYLLDVAKYNDSWYFAAGSSAEGKIYVYKDPINILRKLSLQKPVPSAVLKLDQPASVSFSPDSRFLIVQAGQRFAVFDAEYQRQYKFEIPQPLSSKPATWIDGFHLSAESEGKLLIFDFDGLNLQTLVTVAPGIQAVFSPDYDFAYTFNNSSTVTGRSAIFRHDLVL